MTMVTATVLVVNEGKIREPVRSRVEAEGRR
jgi:hypothetical protein